MPPSFGITVDGHHSLSHVIDRCHQVDEIVPYRRVLHTVQNNSLTKYIDAYISTTIPTTEHRSLEKKLQEYVSSQLKQSDEKYGIFYGLVQIVRKYNQLILKHNLDVEALLCNPFDKIELFLQKFFEAFNSLNNDLDTLQRSLQALKNLKNPLKKAKITALSYDILHLTDPYMLQLLKLDQLNAPEYTGTTWTRHFLAQSSNIRQDMLSAFDRCKTKKAS